MSLTKAGQELYSGDCMSSPIKGGGRIQLPEPVAAVPLTAGGLNALVAAAELDLVARTTGQEFGEANVLSRIVHVVAGLGAVHGITQFTSRNANQASLRSASAGA
jgi:uncharacterized membrane protein YuzA (DUF378 family)